MHVLTRVVLLGRLRLCRDACHGCGDAAPAGDPESLPQALASPNPPPLPWGLFLHLRTVPVGAALTQPCPSPVWWWLPSPAPQRPSSEPRNVR